MHEELWCDLRYDGALLLFLIARYLMHEYLNGLMIVVMWLIEFFLSAGRGKSKIEFKSFLDSKMPWRDRKKHVKPSLNSRV